MNTNFEVFESADIIDVIDNLVSVSYPVSFKRDMSRLFNIYRKKNMNKNKCITISIYSVPFMDEENKSSCVVKKMGDGDMCCIQSKYSELRERLKMFKDRTILSAEEKSAQTSAYETLTQVIHTNVETEQRLISIIRKLSVFVSTMLKKFKNNLMLTHEFCKIMFDIIIFKVKGYELSHYLDNKYADNKVDRNATNSYLISTLLEMIKKKTLCVSDSSAYTAEFITEISSLIYMVCKQFSCMHNSIFNLIMRCMSGFIPNNVCTEITDKFMVFQDKNMDFLKVLSNVTTESVEDFCHNFNNPPAIENNISDDNINIKRQNYLIFGDNIFSKMNGGDTMEAIDMVLASLKQLDANAIRKVLPPDIRDKKITFDISPDNIGYLKYNKIARNCMVLSSPSLLSEINEVRNIISYNDALYLLFQFDDDTKMYGISLSFGYEDPAETKCVMFDRANKKEYDLSMGGVE